MSKAGSYQTPCSLKETTKIAKLVGDICVLQYSINNTRIPILMDTGVQVSIIERRYLNEKSQRLSINPVQALLVSSNSLRAQGGNSKDIPFRGFVN